MIHGGGQSRRLPAYAALGKPLIPVPVLRWSRGQRLDQTLLDLQLPFYDRILEHAPASFAAAITSGDVLIRFGRDLPEFPAVDILAMGLWVRPEEAQHFGVFFCPRSDPATLAFFLQKPSPDRIRALAAEYLFLVDTGIWLLSERAVAALLTKCGWDAVRERFDGDLARAYELYNTMGLALGAAPAAPDPELAALTSGVIPLPQGEFYHFGRGRDLIRSVSLLQNSVLDQTQFGLTAAKPHPDQYTQNAAITCPLLPEHHTLWIENATLGKHWRLRHEHVLTAIPENDWALALEPGVCLDCAPVGQGGDDARCIRAYGIDDPFRGAIGDPATLWFGRPASQWFATRDITWAQAGIDPATDIQAAALFPVVSAGALDPRFIEWLFAERPSTDPALSAAWCRLPRLSALDLGGFTGGNASCEVRRLAAQRARNLARVLPELASNHRRSVFYNLDLNATARLFAAAGCALPHPLPEDEPLLKRVHDAMFRAAALRHASPPSGSPVPYVPCVPSVPSLSSVPSPFPDSQAFALLRAAVIADTQRRPAQPTRQILDDQIIWGRCPVRLDLAGGWTDTPPYCLQDGGRVVNVAVDLNGQAPIQVFARLIDAPELVIRSIDLGTEERIASFDALDTFAQVGSGFAIARAAFALAGFLPRFHGGGACAALADQLRAFGGGIEVSLLAAVPKGSGLGTSSILAATLLGVLSETCGLHWDACELIRRTLALEQMLTTGGGWQDQAGGIFPGIKLVETRAGLDQVPVVRWLPQQLFSHEHVNRTILLYYTGITRVAKGILEEIVRGMFLNAHERISVIDEIGQNALAAQDALQLGDYARLCAVIRRSWQLNQQLDEGTNPPAVQAILDRVRDHVAACKLLGAGGGGYMLFLAKDPEAGERIRTLLTDSPPNAKARFVGLTLSDTGLQITRS